MFLVRSRDEHVAVRPVWREFRELTMRHPFRIQVRRWDILASDMWLVTGSPQGLDSIWHVLSEPWGESPGMKVEPAVWYVSSRAPRVRESLWQRLLGRIQPTRREQRRRIQAIVGQWVEDMDYGDQTEATILADIAHAMVAQSDILILDRVLHVIRPQVRFRVATTLDEACRMRGTTLIAIAEQGYDGWIAVDHRARVRRGILELVFHDD